MIHQPPQFVWTVWRHAICGFAPVHGKPRAAKDTFRLCAFSWDFLFISSLSVCVRVCVCLRVPSNLLRSVFVSIALPLCWKSWIETERRRRTYPFSFLFPSPHRPLTLFSNTGFWRCSVSYTYTRAPLPFRVVIGTLSFVVTDRFSMPAREETKKKLVRFPILAPIEQTLHPVFGKRPHSAGKDLGDVLSSVFA